MKSLLWRIQLWRDARGQDLVEYALLASFVAVSCGALIPNVASNISTIFSSIGSMMKRSASQGHNG